MTAVQGSSASADAEAPAGEETADQDPDPSASAEAGTASQDPGTDRISGYLRGMTLEEKVAQLFIIPPESLTGDGSCATSAGEEFREAFRQTPVGGFLYLGPNLISPEQTGTMLENVRAFSYERVHLPAFLCVDEEGGTVARIANSGSFGVRKFEDMGEIGKRGNREEAFEAGSVIGKYLADLGFNVDFAPVADVLTNAENRVVGKRSFGSDPETVTFMAGAVAEGLASRNILSTYKHFPGHGNTEEDTHQGYAGTDRTMEELDQCELVPFRDGIRRGVPFIMVGHISLPNVTGDDTPASLSPAIVRGLLREKMGYEGIVITDALNMGAIARQYSSEEAAVKALDAGVDMLLAPEDFKAAYQGVLAAVRDGTLSEERIDESLSRVLKAKITLMETGSRSVR